MLELTGGLVLLHEVPPDSVNKDSHNLSYLHKKSGLCKFVDCSSCPIVLKSTMVIKDTTRRYRTRFY